MKGWWAASYVVLWLLVLVLCAIVVALARQIGTLHLRLGPRGALEVDHEGPPLGQAPPPVELVDTSGRKVTIGGPGEAQMILFVSPGCRTCDAVLPGVPAVAAGAGLTPYVVTDLSPEETRYQFADREVDAPLLAGAALARRYEVPGTPYAVVLDPLGIVRAKGTVNNLEQMEGLVDTSVARAHRPLQEQHG